MSGLPDLTAQLDQMGASFREQARALAEYHRGLVEGGVEHAAADTLLRDFAWQWWTKSLWPENGPPDGAPM